MNLTERLEYIENLKKEYFDTIERLTPEAVKKQPIFDLSNENEIVVTINKDLVTAWGLDAWLKNYRLVAQCSTGGIRGPQNVLYPWDTRFTINEVGVALATIAKVLVLKDQCPGKNLHKMVGGEVRYNTDSYVELISRLEAALGIHVHQPKDIHLTTIWMTSFLIFMNDYDGGEYVSSSHAISTKTATKDLDNQGSQFMPGVVMSFVDKIEEIVNEAKTNPAGFAIKLSARNHDLITKDFNGYEMYVSYLRTIVATEANLKLIKQAADKGMRVMFDTVGGCMYENMVPIFNLLKLPEIFDWHNKEEDPFFHGVGKTRRLNPLTNQEEFFDLSCDASLPEVQATIGYDLYLMDKPIGYTVLITDPDGDRLVIGQIEKAEAKSYLEEMGIDYVVIDDNKILSIYHPAFTFLLIMDFHMKHLKQAGLWNNHDRFIISTTPSPRSWDQWAKHNGLKVVNTPVGIKEIAAVLKKTEKQLFDNSGADVLIEDIWGREVNLGQSPRMVFGGEESGGMIIGPEEFIESVGGHKALAMREKSAGESVVIATALASHLFLEGKMMSEHLRDIFDQNNITYRYYLRADIVYYNESEPDPMKMAQAKTGGEKKRDQADSFYLSLALALRENLLTMEQARIILREAMPELEFDSLQEIIFVGDA
ncbi:MAG: hypothetical protein AAB657_00760, partial [Patescibacteria group bacterium]